MTDTITLGTFQALDTTQIWTPTMNLRWFLPHGAAPQAVQDTRVLQQLWTWRNSTSTAGGQEWRDIPTAMV